jgi:hypothetical protein
LLHVKSFAVVVGQIISLQRVVGKIVSDRRTKYLYKCIIARASWNASVKVSEKALNELQFCVDNAHILNTNGKHIKKCFISSLSMTTDATVGNGGYISKENRSVLKIIMQRVHIFLLIMKVSHLSVIDIWKKIQGYSFERILRFPSDVDVIEMVAPGCEHDYQDCIQKSTPSTVVPGSDDRIQYGWLL